MNISEDKYVNLIDSRELQRVILDYINSEDFEKMFNSTIFSTYEDREKYKHAVIHGLVFGSMLTTRCRTLSVEVIDKKDEEKE